MRCPGCRRDNRAGASFCDGCGARLPIACPHCAADLRIGANFCDRCGRRVAEEPSPRTYTPTHLADKIIRDRAQVEGERRTVTVLFTDAVGSTSIGEHLDAEELYRLMQGCVAKMLECVHRYEGTVTQYRGDGIMAIFGAPIAHEDSARRAVAAALAIQSSLGDYSAEIEERYRVDCTFRVGCNTGPVVVGRIGDDLSMDYTALGDTVNLASRMEALAEPGTVYLTEDTYRNVSDHFECEDLGPVQVKGKAEPVGVYKVLRERPIRTRFEIAASRGLTPYVGREHELAVLRQYLQRAVQGRGQVVFVSGQAGIGKSRLLLQLRTAHGSDVAWLEGQCISFGASIPYLPMLGIVKQAFAVRETDDDARIIGRVDSATSSWDAGAQKRVPYLKYLLQVDPGDSSIAVMDPRERRAGILDAMRTLLIQESGRKPLAVCVEDLHWMDEASEEALKSLVDLVAALPVLLICTYRPAYAHALGEPPHSARLALDELTPEAGRTIASHVLGTSELPDEIARLITAKAEGNPFFVEEVTKSLVEEGTLERRNDGYRLTTSADEVKIPNTIQEVVLARIDRLHHEAREAIQLASVIGREFTVRLLDRISDLEAKLDDVLGELRGLELIYATAFFPELAYMFKHALTHEVALSTLLYDRRKTLHRVVAAAIEELYADRLAEQYETLAHHYEHAELWDKALEYLDLAGDKARAAFANQEALAFYERAADVSQRSSHPEAVIGVAEKRGFVNFLIARFEEAAADFQRMADAARGSGDEEREGMALAHRGMAEFWEHDFERAEATLREALAIGERGHGTVEFAATTWLSGMLVVINRHPEADPLARRAAAWASGTNDALSTLWSVGFDGLRRQWEGNYEAGLERIGSVSTTVDSGGSVAALIARLNWEVWTLAGMGRYQEALDLISQIISTADLVGEVAQRARALNTRGWILGELQDHEQAIEWNERSAEASLGLGVFGPEVRSNALLNLADDLIALGRLDEAEPHLREVESIVRHPTPEQRWMLWRYSQHFFHTAGELRLKRGDHVRALSLAEECLALASQSASRKNVVKAGRLKGEAMLAAGLTDDAQLELEAALEVALRVGNPPQLWKTWCAVGEVYLAQGRPHDAVPAYASALLVVESVASGLTDQTLRDTFLGSPHVSEIREAARA